MKIHVFAAIAALGLFLSSAALAQQAPQKFNYQAVARDASGKALAEQKVALRIAIMSGDDLDRPVYAEQHTVTTNRLGLFNIAIGSGEVLEGGFSAIDWGSAAHYLSIQMDTEGNGQFEDLGLAQLLSVPYALYAERSGTAADAGGVRNDPNDWSMNGNAGTDDAVNFIGTLDAQDLVVKTNSEEVARFATNGNLILSPNARIMSGSANMLNALGTRNINIGRDAGAVNSGSQNTFIGSSAGMANTTGYDNSFIGPAAGRDNTTGYRNLFIGFSSGRTNTTGYRNSFIGGQAGYGNTEGFGNSAIGFRAGYANTTGDRNTFVGDYAGQSNTTGSFNTYIGKEADGASDLENATAIGAGAYAAHSNSVILGNNANVGIGTSAPVSGLHVAQTDGIQMNVAQPNGAMGGIYFRNGYDHNSGRHYHLGITTYDHSSHGTGFSDGLVISGYDGIGFTTSNTTEDTLSHVRMFIDQGGNVGIGTSTPLAKLHVEGPLKLVDGTEANGYVLATDAAGNASWMSPTDLSIDTLSVIADADRNTMIQVEEGTNDNTIRFDIAGTESFRMNKTTGGLHNLEVLNNAASVFIGEHAGDAATSGSTYGTYVGYRAGASSTGIQNTYIGWNAGTNNTTGGGNVFLGNDAGGSSTGGGHVFIGQKAGQNATGSQKLYIENSNSESPLIYGEFNTNIVGINGKLGVGTQSPSDKLHVEGSIRMVDGNEAAGYIPVSDVNGKMIWTDPATITTAADADADSTNELQTLSISGNDITLSNGGGTVSVPIQTVLADADNDTKIQVEESADEDIIRFDIDSTEAFVMKKTAGGFYALEQGGTGSLFIGTGAGTSSTHPNNFNTFIGHQSGRDNDGLNNTFVGLNAGRFNPSGSSNTYVGTFAGGSSTGGGNVFLGFQAGNTATGSDKLYIENSGSNSPLIYGEFDNDLIRINGDLEVTGSFPVDTLSIIADADGNTKIQVEKNTNDDVIRFDIAGTEAFTIKKTAGGFFSLSEPNAGAGLFIGTNAGNTVTHPNNYNTFIGYGSGQMTTGIQNTYIGMSAGQLNVSGSNNTFVGLFTGRSSTGGGNVFIGYTVGETETGSNKLFIDNSNTSSPLIYGEFNHDLVGINGNLGVGTEAPDVVFHVSADATGDSTGIKLTQGTANSVIYHNSENDLIIRKLNQSDQLVLDNSGRIGIGTSAPDNQLHVMGTIQMQDGNEQSGYIAVSDANGKMVWSDPTSISDGDWTASGNDLFSANSGNVGVGTSSPSSILHIADSFAAAGSYVATVENTGNGAYSNGLQIKAGQNTQSVNNRYISFVKPNGTEIGAVRQTSSSGVDYNTTSDERLKTNITPTAKGLQDLMQIEVKDYVYKEDPKKPQTGFIAQQVYKHYPNAVSVGGDDAKTDPWMMDYGKMTPLLVKAVQDQQALIIKLQQEVIALKEQIRKN